jgi:hypothetical protein
MASRNLRSGFLCSHAARPGNAPPAPSCAIPPGLWASAPPTAAVMRHRPNDRPSACSGRSSCGAGPRRLRIHKNTAHCRVRLLTAFGRGHPSVGETGSNFPWWAAEPAARFRRAGPTRAWECFLRNAMGSAPARWRGLRRVGKVDLSNSLQRTREPRAAWWENRSFLRGLAPLLARADDGENDSM